MTPAAGSSGKAAPKKKAAPRKRPANVASVAEPSVPPGGEAPVEVEARAPQTPTEEPPAAGAAKVEPQAPAPEPAALSSEASVSHSALADLPAPRKVLHSRRAFTGRVWDVTTDLVNLGAAGVVTRDYVQHPGAVAVMVLNDAGHVYLVRQYRHPVRTETWEPPAGLLDVAGEDPLAAARRELHEEADLTAARWDVLADFYTSPGGSSEGIRMYLARDVSEVPADERHEREEEEREMVGAWVPLADVLAALAAGTVQGPTLTIGALALDAALRSDGATLRPAHTPWHRPPARGQR